MVWPLLPLLASTYRPKVGLNHIFSSIYFSILLSVYCNLQPSIQIWFLPQIAKVTVKIIFFTAYGIQSIMLYITHWIGMKLKPGTDFHAQQPKLLATILYCTTALILYLNSLASCYCSYNLVRTTLEHLKLLTYKKELSIPHSLYAYCNTTYSGDGDFYILHTFRKSHFRKSIVMVPSIVKHLAMN